MVSCIISDMTINEAGLLSPSQNNRFSWNYIVKNKFTFNFKKDSVGWGENSDALEFFWVEVRSPVTLPFRIHFPKGREQYDNFRSLVAYYLLKTSGMLDTLSIDNTAEINNFIKLYFFY